MAMGIHYWPALLDMTEEQCKVKLRCMELEAYSCIVSVLRARGPLTEEKLNFMKQCAKEFHISQERHKVEIRKASNDELLSTIADTLYGPNTESKWFIEGRRLAPVLNTEPRQSVYIELANRMAEIARAHNASLPSYSQYKDEVITIENAHLKREEEALVEDLAKATKEKETPTSVPDVVESTSITTTTTTITTASTTSPSTQIIEIMEEDVLEDGKVSEEEKQSVEVKAPPSPRGEKREAPPSSKSPQGRRKKRLSIEMIKDDGSSTPPKRFSNIPPPRIPATPVSQRPPRFQSINTTPHQPSPRIVVLPGGIHQQPHQHSSMTHINTNSGSSVRKPMSKPSGPPPPPIISKIQRPRMFTPMKTLNFSAGPDARMKSSAPSPVSSTSGGGVTKANNLILLQKTNKMSGNTTTTLPNRITIANPNKKEPVSKFLVNRPMAPQTTVSSTGGKSVILKSAGSSSQNNVILVDITQDQLSGNLSVEELLKVSGLSSTPGTVANTSVSKTPTTPQHSIIKLQNPKSLGSLPTNIQQIKIIKSSGTKLFLPTSVGSTMETVLSLAQSSTVSSSTTMSSSFTSSSTTGMGPRMSVAPVSNASPSTPRPALSRFTPNTPRPVSAPYKAPNPAVTHSTVSSSTSHSTTTSSNTISSASSLADWLSNYVVSGFQKMDGLEGPLVIRRPKKADPNRDQYDTDYPSHTIIITDWLHGMTDAKFPGNTYANFGTRTESFLINGRSVFKSGNGTSNPVPYSKFKVNKGLRHRFRIIGGSCLACPMLFFVEKHRMNLITVDGTPVQPQMFDSITIFPGDRMDVVITANQSGGSFWIQVRTLCTPNVSAEAILEYSEGNGTKEQSTRPAFDAYPRGRSLNALDSSDCSDTNPNVCWNHVNSLTPATEKATVLKAVPDIRLVFAVDEYHFTRDSLFWNDEDEYHRWFQSSPNVIKTHVTNNISLGILPFPILSQDLPIPKEMECPKDRSVCGKSAEKGGKLCECVEIIKVGLNQVAEIIFIDWIGPTSTFLHPMHLHGTDIYIIEQGIIPVAEDHRAFVGKLQERLAREGPDLATKIRPQPCVKDTVTIPPNGYTVVRVHFNNPGIWIMHCHFIFHTETGMNTVFQVGDRKDFVQTPPEFPTCNNYLPPVDPNEFKNIDWDDEPTLQT